MDDNIENITVDNNNMTVIEKSKKLTAMSGTSTLLADYDKNSKRTKTDPILISWIKLPKAIYYFFKTDDLDK